MVRRLKIDRTKPAKREGQIDLLDFVAEPEKAPARKRKPKPLGPSDFNQLLTITNEMKNSQDWEQFKPRNFVALYCLLHSHVYGVVPEEVRDSFSLAVAAAKRQLAKEFDDDKGRMVDFIRWVWGREMNRNKHRDADNDFRIGWRLQFGKTLLSDYRVARARKGRKVQ